MKKSLFLLLFCLGQAAMSFAQILAPQVLGSGGTSGSNASTKISYTIGQTVTVAGGSGNSLLTQGFHQSNLPLLDSLPCYEIGEIPPQTVFQGTEKAFYVCVGSKDVAVSMEIKSTPPSGEMTFNSINKRFSFIPSINDKGIYEVVFYAISNKDTTYQEVPFLVVPALPAEQTAFGLKPVVPIPADDDDGYVIITLVKGTREYFNHTERETNSISIAGKTLVFDKQIANKLKTFCDNPRNDVKELTLYAEKVIIRCALRFPQTNVTIYARSLVFEDGSEKASINTQPEAPTAPQGNVNGSQAGSITLYLQHLSTDFEFRFRLIGGSGQGTGNGGNGGVLSSNLDLKTFMDAAPGSAGASGLKGAAGGFQSIAQRHTWLHPYALRLVIAHTKVAYLNGHWGYTQKIADDYVQMVAQYKASTEWGATGEESQVELSQLQDEMASISERIANNQDYYGNPAGWVPLLSFEVNKIAFEEEIDHAIKVLYFCYWLQRINANNEQKNSALISVKKQQEELLMAFQNAYNQAIALLPQLEAQADAVAAEIDIIQKDLEQLEQELLERSKYVVEERHKPPKRSSWRKIVGTVGAIAQVVPLYQPALGAIGTGLQVISNLDFGKPLDAVKQMYNVAKDISKVDFSKSADSLKSLIDSLDFTNIRSGKKLLSYAKNVGTFLAPLVTTLADLREKTGPTKVPLEEIQVELDKMRAESPEFTDLTNRTNDLMMEKLQFQQRIAGTLQTVTKVANDIQAALVTIDGINLQVFNTGSKRDLRAMIYIKDMEERAKERLTRYHYNLAKAYEYRLLEPYDSDLNLTEMVDRFKNIAETKGNNVELSKTEFELLREAYNEVLAKVTDNILRKYNDNAPEMFTSVNFSLTPEDLDQLNKGQPVNLNLVERGLIQPNEEAPRIREFRVESIKMHLENGQPGSFAYFDVVMEHSGLSKLKKDGQVYFFNHYNNRNTNPISWSVRYDVRDQTITSKAPSPSVSSLLKSLLDKLNKFSSENLELYSRPAAWADIIVNKYDNSSNGVKMVIDELRFNVVYDFHQIPSGLITLEVVTNKDLKPLISMGLSDKNQRQDGWGSFLRTYFKNANSTMNINTPAQYGVWAFENWTDFSGNIISAKNEISVNLGSNKMLKANYKLIQPELFVPNDTIRLPGKQGTQKVTIQNIGTGEMGWTCSGSNDWLSFQSDSTGLNNGEVTLEFKDNQEKTPRIQKLLVVAPSSIRYLDTITVIQSPISVSTSGANSELTYNLSIYPNPARDEINIEVIGNVKPASIIVYNSLGVMLKQTQMNGSRTTLRLDGLAKGLYFVEMMLSGRRYVRKVILE
ncbi:T9SS type A sorting domain-containing protein [Haliscomenobacter hydrossis]|uniref:Secretion system C-terminal sorting domain-containing protein n=1 Tax=Haliscomenobacter hydrossis (strain ATCC 27775 / DSM 1100 / LMG 10767 / O) TaxID=760192 RepID=F4KQ08_HALH1|nr:T9SS type A sorting domain-containing protein [Haliscomenobacter hydrossis]AEE53212.1 hypothetical protein Halhy_5387 [Haliscomenobacter hydrossis DSM 1100]